MLAVLSENVILSKLGAALDLPELQEDSAVVVHVIGQIPAPEVSAMQMTLLVVEAGPYSGAPVALEGMRRCCCLDASSESRLELSLS